MFDAINIDSNIIALYGSLTLNLLLGIRLFRKDRKEKKEKKDKEIPISVG